MLFSAAFSSAPERRTQIEAKPGLQRCFSWKNATSWSVTWRRKLDEEIGALFQCRGSRRQNQHATPEAAFQPYHLRALPLRTGGTNLNRPSRALFEQRRESRLVLLVALVEDHEHDPRLLIGENFQNPARDDARACRRSLLVVARNRKRRN